MEQHFTPSPSPTPKTLLHNRNEAMNNLQNFVLKLAQAHPNAPLAPPAETLLRDRLDRFVSDYRTPDHPPYSHMIENALEELNKKAGSTKKSISLYLEKKYDNLPWAHSVLLKHHLEKACERGEIIVTRTKKYQLAGSLNSSTKVERKPRQRKWRWECERQKHHQLKIRLIKKRKNQRGEAVEKHQECDKKGQPLTENGVHGEDQTKSLLSFVDEKKCSEEVRSQQENGPSSIAKADISAAYAPEHQEREPSEHDQPELLTPERPPGFESVMVENLHQLGSTEPEPVLQSEPYMTIDSFKLSPTSNEQELLQQPPSQKDENFHFQGKQLRRSLRTRPGPAKELEGCPEVRQGGTLLKQRPRSRPPMKATSMDELQDSPKSQKQRVLLKQKPVKNLKVVDDCREQEFEHSGKVAECTSMHEKMEVLPLDNSKPHLQKALKEQRLGSPPKRRSARLLKRR